MRCEELSIMKFLFLRGQVPQDRNPKEIVFDSIDECDDMWTQLAFEMSKHFDETELWYWGGTREKMFSSTFIERWIPSFKTHNTDFVPDVIMCRGGFKEYHDVLERYPNAYKIYYGAGRRYLPQPGFHDYDLILQDNIEQLKESQTKFPKSKSILYIKPAADNIFYPHEITQEYDICFPANGAQTFKGHSFVYQSIPKDFSLLNLGNKSKLRPPSNAIQKRVLRTNMAKNISRCRVGIVAVSSAIDSCPRVIPEMLACNIPIVVMKNVRFWHEKYIIPGITGEIATKENFWETVQHVLENRIQYQPYKYYKENLSLDHAANYIIDQITIL